MSACATFHHHGHRGLSHSIYDSPLVKFSSAPGSNAALSVAPPRRVRLQRDVGISHPGGPSASFSRNRFRFPLCKYVRGRRPFPACRRACEPGCAWHSLPSRVLLACIMCQPARWFRSRLQTPVARAKRFLFAVQTLQASMNVFPRCQRCP